MIVILLGVDDSPVETIGLLTDLAGGDRFAVRTGHGGLVVSDELAYEWLSVRLGHTPVAAHTPAEPALDWTAPVEPQPVEPQTTGPTPATLLGVAPTEPVAPKRRGRPRKSTTAQAK